MREGAKQSMGEVARRLGVTVPFLSDVERGNRGPLAPAKLLVVCALLGVDPTELLELAARSRGTFELDATTPERARAGAVLLRSWEHLSNDALEELAAFVQARGLRGS